jgi:hypothetical protein
MGKETQEYKITVYPDGHWSIELLFGTTVLGLCASESGLDNLVETIKELYPVQMT